MTDSVAILYSVYIFIECLMCIVLECLPCYPSLCWRHSAYSETLNISGVKGSAVGSN